MEWQEDGIVLATALFGESELIVTLATAHHGRHRGLVRGGASSRQRGTWQPGNLVRARWVGRLPDQLGHYTGELIEAWAAPALEDADALALLAAACAVTDGALPEHEAHPEALIRLARLLARIAEGAALLPDYVRFEIALLAELGYGLDLSACAATGRNDQLAYVSPRTGRAVSLSAGEPWKDRLFRLPPFLLDAPAPAAPVPPADILAGMAITGHFLEQHAFGIHHRPLPAARTRLLDRIALAASIAPAATETG